MMNFFFALARAGDNPAGRRPGLPMSANPWRSSLPTAVTSPRTRPRWSRSSTPRKSRSSPSPMRGADRRFIRTPRATSLQQMGDEEIDEDLDALLKGAPYLITHKVVHQRISQSPMETRGIVAIRDGTEELTLYITCQSPHVVARWTSLALGLPQTAIRVIAKDVRRRFRSQEPPMEGRGRGHPRRAQLRSAVEMDRRPLREPRSPPIRRARRKWCCKSRSTPTAS